VNAEHYGGGGISRRLFEARGKRGTLQHSQVAKALCLFVSVK
jgi:hypothetical protein